MQREKLRRLSEILSAHAEGISTIQKNRKPEPRAEPVSPVTPKDLALLRTLPAYLQTFQRPSIHHHIPVFSGKEPENPRNGDLWVQGGEEGRQDMRISRGLPPSSPRYGDLCYV